MSYLSSVRTPQNHLRSLFCILDSTMAVLPLAASTLTACDDAIREYEEAQA